MSVHDVLQKWAQGKLRQVGSLNPDPATIGPSGISLDTDVVTEDGTYCAVVALRTSTPITDVALTATLRGDTLMSSVEHPVAGLQTEVLIHIPAVASPGGEALSVELTAEPEIDVSIALVRVLKQA